MSDGVTAIDSSVFTFNPSTLKITAYSTDTTKVGVYNFLITGTLDAETSTTGAFKITIYTKCYDQSITAATTSNQAY
jgi:hypothetical protein